MGKEKRKCYAVLKSHLQSILLCVIIALLYILCQWVNSRPSVVRSSRVEGQCDDGPCGLIALEPGTALGLPELTETLADMLADVSVLSLW